MNPSAKITIGIVVVIFLLLGGRFIYYNIVVPWPYRNELKQCLGNAEQKATEQEIENARNQCFRTYPHFN